MDIFFTDPSDAPVPPEEVRIRELSADPWPDGRRVKVYLEVTPFLKRPSGEVRITDAEGIPVASANIIEAMTPKMEINLHLRAAELSGDYTVAAEIFYLTGIPEADDDEETPIRPERMIVDQATATFVIP